MLMRPFLPYSSHAKSEREKEKKNPCKQCNFSTSVLETLNPFCSSKTYI